MKRPSILEGLHGCPALAVFPLIGPFVIVVFHEDIQVDLDFINGFVKLLSEGNFIEFVLDHLVESFSGPIRLRMPHLGSGMFYSTQMKEELIEMSFDSSAVLGASIR